VRVAAVHDSAGYIVSLLAGPSDGPRMGMELEPWQYVHEVDIPDLTLDADDSDLHRGLNYVMENFRVELPPGVDDAPTARLIKR
jgi:hypothetical protein